MIEVDGTLWEIIEDNEEEDTEDISILTPNNDGTYSYIMQFYNGGTCLSEMLEDGIKNIKEEWLWCTHGLSVKFVTRK